MSQTSLTHNTLHLVIEGFAIEKLDEFTKSQPGTAGVTTVFPLTELTAPEALKSIFVAETIAVWGKL
jgi:hypothetical protein